MLSHVQLCDPMNCSTPGLPAHHQLPELTQTHVHWVSEAIQPSHPLSSFSPPAFNLSQHQGLFQWASSVYQVAKVLELQIQRQAFQWVFRVCIYQFSSVQSLSCVWLLGPHGMQKTRLPCPSPTPGACPDSCPLSRWCHPTISSSVVPLSSCLQSFPASASFPISQFFTSGGQSIGVSASALVLSMNIQDWFPLGLTCLISLQSKGLSKSLPQHHSSKASILRHSAFFKI